MPGIAAAWSPPCARWAGPRLLVGLILASGLAGAAGPARAVSTTLSDGVTVRWDNTLTYGATLRLLPAQAALLANANADDGDRAFRPGLVSSRFDLLSELDVGRDAAGAFASAAGWFDPVYLGDNANTSPASFNPVSVSHSHFPASVQAQQGAGGELLDGYLHDRFDLAGLPVVVRAGRHTLLWGESLLFPSNGIAGGQAPVDQIRMLSQPLAQAREVFLPVGQLSLTATLSPGVTFEAYQQPEWRADRLPGVASYFSTADSLGAGGERLFINPGAATAGALGRGHDASPGGGAGLTLGQYGVALRLEHGDVDAGLYALRYAAKTPQIRVDLPRRLYSLDYRKDIALYGVSASTYLGNSTLAGEISIRYHEPLASLPGAGASGDAWHGQISTQTDFAPSWAWGAATLAAEIAFNDRLRIQNAGTLAPGRDRFAMAVQAIFTPRYFRVAPGLDLAVPLGLGLGVVGRSSTQTTPDQGAGQVSIGLDATYRAVWRASLLLTAYVGSPSRQPLADRDFVTVQLSRSF